MTLSPHRPRAGLATPSLPRRAALAATLGLAACASWTAYSVEGARETALVRFTTDYEHLTLFDAIDTAGCPGSASKHRLAGLIGTGLGSDGEVSTVKMYGGSTKKEPLILERAVVAGRPLAMLVSGGFPAAPYAPGATCDLGAVFMPRSGARYEVGFRHDANRCTVRIWELTRADDGAIGKRAEPSARLVPAKSPTHLCGA